MKITKTQAKWMEGAMLFATLYVSTQAMGEVVEQIDDKDIELAYESFMRVLNSHQSKLKEQLEIVEDDE